MTIHNASFKRLKLKAELSLLIVTKDRFHTKLNKKLNCFYIFNLKFCERGTFRYLWSSSKIVLFVVWDMSDLPEMVMTQEVGLEWRTILSGWCLTYLRLWWHSKLVWNKNFCYWTSDLKVDLVRQRILNCDYVWDTLTNRSRQINCSNCARSGGSKQDFIELVFTRLLICEGHLVKLRHRIKALTF